MEHLVNNSADDPLLLSLKESNGEHTLGKVHGNQFAGHHDEQRATNDRQSHADGQRNEEESVNSGGRFANSSRAELLQLTENERHQIAELLNEHRHSNDVLMQGEEAPADSRPAENSSPLEQPASPMEADESMKRKLRLRNDLNKRKLRHLNKRRAEQSKRAGEDGLHEDGAELDGEINQSHHYRIHKRLASSDEQSNHNQSSNIVDLLTKNSSRPDDEELNEDSIKKATAYLGLQKLIQLLQQQQTGNQENNQDEEDNQPQENAVEPPAATPTAVQPNPQQSAPDNQSDNQQPPVNPHAQSEPNKSWLLNAAAAATFPLERLQCEALAKQSPALLHQQLMMVQLLQQLQQQAVNESANEEERLNEQAAAKPEKSKPTSTNDEPMDCDQQQSTGHSPRSLFDLQNLQKSTSITDTLNSKSKLNFGNLTPSSTVSGAHQSTNTATTTAIGGAPVPTRPAHTMNPISTSSSLFTSSSITSISNQLNRLSNPLPQNSSNQLNNKPIPIENLILMPEDLPAGVEAQPQSKNPLELLQHTAEKALQKTMKGASFLVNGDGENNENNSDDPANKHKCKFCEKVFGSDSAMQIHIRSHTGERPFKCNVCGNRFSTRGNLKVHFTRHAQKYPNVKMNANPIPEHMDKYFPPIEPPGSSQSPPAQFQPEDDLLAVNNIGINFAQALAQQKQRQLPDINLLAANLSTDRLDTFSRELLLANSNNFLLKNSPNSSQLNDTQLMSLSSSRSSAAAKLETIELADNSVKDSVLESKQKKAVNESMSVLTAPDSAFKSSVLNQLNQNIPVTSGSTSACSSSLNLPAASKPSTSPTFGQLNNNSSTNKENDSSDELSNYNMMLDYFLKAKQRKATADQPDTQANAEFASDKSGNMNTLLSELAQQQAFNPNLAAATAAANLVSSLFSSFLPPNLQPSIYQQLPAYLSQLLQHQLPFAGQQPLQQQQQQQLTSNGRSSSSSQIDQTSTVASLLQLTAAGQTNLPPTNSHHHLDMNPELCNPNNSNSLIKTHHSTSPSHHRSQSSPIGSLQQQQQNLLGTVLNLNNSMQASRSTGRNSPNSSFNSAHDFDLNSVLSASPRNSPNIRQQLSQLAALTSSSNANPHQLLTSPVHSLAANSTPTPSQTSSINAYQDLLPKPGSTDNAWESLMEVEKDSEVAKIKKLVEGCEQKITDPNQCVVCQRILSCKSALQMHYRTHTGERPFKCKLCQRAFTTKGNLKTHMSVHRQKPSLRSMHECPVCRQQFTNALVLQQHVKQQHNQPDERQLIQAHQKAQQQLQYAAAMERIMMAAHQQKTGENLGFPANLADDPFFASLQQQNFNFAQLQAQLQNSMDRQSNDSENSLEAAAQQFFSQNGRLSEMFKQSFADENSRNYEEDEEFDDKEDMSDSKENCDDEDLEGTADEMDRNLDGDLCEENDDDEESQPNQPKQGNNDTSSDHNSSPNDSFHQQLANQSRQSEPIHNMNEDSIASTISSSAGALDLTPKQQQAMAAHLQQLNNNMNNSSNSSQSSGSGNGSGSGQLLNIPNMPSFQLSARGANTTCRICLKTFACASALTIHYRSHSKERPFKCQVCERGFSTKGNMKQHLLTHKLRDFPPNVLGPNLNVSGNNQLSSLMLNAAASVMNGGNASGLGNNSANHSSNSADQLIGSKAAAADLNGLKEKLDLAGVINAVNGSGENCLLKSSSSSTSSGGGGGSSTKQSRNLALQRQQLQQLNGDCQSDASCEANEADERRSVTSLNGSGQFERSGGNLSGNESSSSSLLLNNNELKRIGNLTNSITSNLTASLNSANASTSSVGSGSNGVSAELKHMCEICVKPFSSHSALQIHNRTHTGEKPFACRICSRPFTTKGNLKVHMGTHISGTHMFSSQSRRGRRISVEMNFPNFNLMESNNWIG